jgi:hypothetical protein
VCSESDEASTQTGLAAWPTARKESDMFIGEIEEIGVIEPLVVPESLPLERESEPADRRRVEEPVPAG